MKGKQWIGACHVESVVLSRLRRSISLPCARVHPSAEELMHDKEGDKWPPPRQVGHAATPAS